MVADIRLTTGRNPSTHAFVGAPPSPTTFIPTPLLPQKDSGSGSMVTPGKPKREYTFRAPINEERLKDKLLYYAYRSKEEMEREAWFPGNIFSVVYGDEELGEAQVILVEAQKVEDLTVYDALLTGFQTVDDLRDAVVQWFDFKGNVEKHGFFKVLYRWL